MIEHSKRRTGWCPGSRHRPSPWGVHRWSLWGVLSLFACAGTDGESSAQELAYCDVEPIIERYCLRCHGDPLDHHAPFSLTSWDLMQEDYPPGSGIPIWQAMEDPIERNVMPMESFPLDPPVEPLPEADKARLLAWIRAGAPRGGRCAP